MKSNQMESEIKFPLSHPTHYIACLNNFDVTHVAVKLSRQTLRTLFVLIFAGKLVDFFNINLRLVRQRKPKENFPLISAFIGTPAKKGFNLALNKSSRPTKTPTTTCLSRS